MVALRLGKDQEGEQAAYLRERERDQVASIPPCILVDVGFPIETRQIRAPLVQRDRKKA